MAKETQPPFAESVPTEFERIFGMTEEQMSEKIRQRITEIAKALDEHSLGDWWKCSCGFMCWTDPGHGAAAAAEASKEAHRLHIAAVITRVFPPGIGDTPDA